MLLQKLDKINIKLLLKEARIVTDEVNYQSISESDLIHTLINRSLHLILNELCERPFSGIFKGLIYFSFS